MRNSTSGTAVPRNFKSLFVATLVFLVVAAIAGTLVWRLEQRRLQVVRAQVANIAVDDAADLQRRIDRAISAIYALAALVRQGNGTITGFESVARELLPFYPGAVALQLAPGGVIRQIAPLSGNEKALGHDLLQDTARNKEAILARDSGKLTLAGPFELIQGGVGVVARLPLFLENNQGKPAFWGFTTVLLRFPDLLEQTLISKLAERGFGYELWRIHPDTGSKQVISSSSSSPLNRPVEHLMNVPNGAWTLSIAPDKGWGNPAGFALMASLGLLFSLLVAWLAKLLVDSKGYESGLEALVAERTNDLEKSALALRSELVARIRAEETLKESTKRLTTILDGINALIYVADIETYEILFVNRYGRDIWGEIIGKICWGTLQAGQSGPCGFCTNNRLLTPEGEPSGVYAWEFQNTVNGSWFDCRDQAIRWSDGRLVRMEIATDITPRKKAEETLKLQSSALQAAANAILITDSTGTIEWINPAFTELTGYTWEECIGRNPRELFRSGVHDQAFYGDIWKTLASGQVWRGQITNRRKDGTLYQEGQTITPVKDAGGKTTHFIAIKRDLSEHIKLEEQLRQSQKMESIGTLAGGIAHDFNNILTAIIGYGQIALMKMTADDPLRHNVEYMLEGADRAAHLTKELLLFSRKQSVDKISMDLNATVAKVQKFLKKVIGEDITIQLMLHEGEMPVTGDPYQIEQVVMNLVGNARDAMPKGGRVSISTEIVTLDEHTISADGDLSPGSYALLTVTDSGEGMDEYTRKRIFEPFFTTKDVGKGTGLGLAVSYGIVKQHDGFINVYSEPGIGSTFRVYLPLIADARDYESSAEGSEDIPCGDETILLAEDDEMVRSMTTILLTGHGYKVIEAVDGADALKRYRESSSSIDLLLLDLIMPKMNGKEAFDEIRKVRPDIKAIFSSGYAPETIRQKASLSDGAHLIAKPSSPAELLRKVRSVLDEE